jgi:SAM-dependent methyltransferase
MRISLERRPGIDEPPTTRHGVHAFPARRGLVMARRMSPIVIAALAIGAALLMRRARGHITSRHEPGGILMPDAPAYDRHSRLLLGSLFRTIASDIAATAPLSARVLEVGCGPGHLSNRLARDHDLDVTGLDLDPAMIERANANAERSFKVDRRAPSFLVGDVASLPFDDSSFDLIVSTFSMHHWSDPTAGLAEVARVLRPGGRALIWDLREGCPLFFHGHAPDPTELVRGSPLRLVTVRPWHWPWRLTLSQRLELARE